MELDEEKILQDFATRIRIRRYEMRLSQMELAEIVGCHLNSIGRIERGEVDPSYTLLIKLAIALKVDAREFF